MTETLRRTVAVPCENIFLFLLFFGGVVITVSCWSPVEAPAPDSAVNHGWLMRLRHTHPIPTYTNTNQGIPYSSRQGLLLLQAHVFVIPAVCAALINYLLLAGFRPQGHSRAGHGNVMLLSLTSKRGYLILLATFPAVLCRAKA